MSSKTGQEFVRNSHQRKERVAHGYSQALIQNVVSRMNKISIDICRKLTIIDSGINVRSHCRELIRLIKEQWYLCSKLQKIFGYLGHKNQQERIKLSLNSVGSHKMQVWMQNKLKARDRLHQLWEQKRIERNNGEVPQQNDKDVRKLPTQTLTEIKIPKYQLSYPSQPSLYRQVLDFDFDLGRGEGFDATEIISSQILWFLNNRGGLLNIQCRQTEIVENIVLQLFRKIFPQPSKLHSIYQMLRMHNLISVQVFDQFKQKKAFFIKNDKQRYCLYSKCNEVKGVHMVKGLEIYKFLHDKFRGVKTNLKITQQKQINLFGLQQIFLKSQKVFIVQSNYSFNETKGQIIKRLGLNNQQQIDFKMKNLDQLNIDQTNFVVRYFLIYDINYDLNMRIKYIDEQKENESMMLRWNHENNNNKNKNKNNSNNSNNSENQIQNSSSLQSVNYNISYVITQINYTVQFNDSQNMDKSKLKILKQIWPNCTFVRQEANKVQFASKMHSLIFFLEHNKCCTNIRKLKANFLEFPLKANQA